MTQPSEQMGLRIKKGSSRNSGEGGADFEEEIIVIAETVSDAFDNFDLVVDPFQQAGVEWPATVGKNSV